MLDSAQCLLQFDEALVQSRQPLVDEVGELQPRVDRGAAVRVLAPAGRWDRAESPDLLDRIQLPVPACLRRRVLVAQPFDLAPHLVGRARTERLGLESLIASGTTATLKPADNSTVKGLLYRTGYSGNTGAFFATSTFGNGRVAFWGDSSPIDDGTGQAGNTLYDGWNDASATNAALALNATAWLSGATGDGGGGGGGTDPCTAAQLLRNNGFESGATSWSATGGVITNASGESPRTGSYYAWLDGNGTATTDTVSQSVTGTEGSKLQTSFVLDDTAVGVG